MNTMQLEINGKEYTFKASIKFMRALNEKVKTKSGDREVELGMTYALGGIIGGEIEDLIDVLYAMNIGFSPRIKKEELETYIEDCDDIDSLFKKVSDFLSKANVSKKKYEQIQKAMKQTSQVKA